MRISLSRASVALFVAALFLAACQSFASFPNGIADLFSNAGRGRMLAVHFRGAHPSHAWRKYNGVKRLLNFPTHIQHVVVIVMENRSVDNLFAAYYSSNFCGTSHSSNCGTALDLHNPAAQPTLYPNGLGANFDPDHHHDLAWMYDTQGKWAKPPNGCHDGSCMGISHPSQYSYVPSTDTGIYAQLIQNWAFANNVLQANEGPSFVAHQYFIAGQSGGVYHATSSPNAEAENPQKSPTPYPTGNFAESDSDVDMMTTAGCNPTGGYQVKTINMAVPAPSPTTTPLDNGATLAPPCEEYGGAPTYDNTILDEVAGLLGNPADADWEYIAHADDSIWAAPLGVNHLYNQWQTAGSPCGPTADAHEPFVCDPDAEQFVSDIGSSSPFRPFPALTYITPCGFESDHPEPRGTGQDGPEWLAWVLNAIGQSQYWNSTAIIVTWDDWGGWYDHQPLSQNGGPVRPPNNPYSNNVSDPNEWGFRVPLIVISPYINARGFISNSSTSGFTWRSQSVTLQFAEAIFGVPMLGGDDEQNEQTDALQDMFNMSPSPSPLPYVAVTEPPGWSAPSGVGTCQSGFTGGGPSYRHRKNPLRHKPLHIPPVQINTTVLRPPEATRLPKQP